jgi:flagellar biosynthesis/type III secretory pathway protein FliH
MRGNPETHREALQEERRTGATQGFTEGSVDRMRDSRQLEDPSPANRRMQNAGQPVDSSDC